jgi:hypothetical protein
MESGCCIVGKELPPTAVLIIPGVGDARGCLGVGEAAAGFGAGAGLDMNPGRGCAVLFKQPNSSTATTSFTTRAAEGAPSGCTLVLLNTCSANI